MAPNRELNATDAKRVLRRYWWILPISTVLLTTVAWVAANVLPKRYSSQTTVLVEQPSVSSKYVDPVVSDDLNHRLATMQEQILSRSRLQPIIEKLNLYPEDQGRAHIDDQVERLRSAITVKPVESMQGTGPHQLPGFYITATFETPQLAQQVCTEITSMFLAQNARQTEQQATRTTSFLGEQLAGMADEQLEQCELGAREVHGRTVERDAAPVVERNPHLDNVEWIVGDGTSLSSVT